MCTIRENRPFLSLTSVLLFVVPALNPKPFYCLSMLIKDVAMWHCDERVEWSSTTQSSLPTNFAVMSFWCLSTLDCQHVPLKCPKALSTPSDSCSHSVCPCCFRNALTYDLKSLYGMWRGSCLLLSLMLPVCQLLRTLKCSYNWGPNIM